MMRLHARHTARGAINFSGKTGASTERGGIMCYYYNHTHTHTIRALGVTPENRTLPTQCRVYFETSVRARAFVYAYYFPAN